MLNHNSRECSVDFQYDQVDENPDDPIKLREEAVYSTADLMEKLRWLVSFIREKERCRISVDCLYLALGDAYVESITMTSIADFHGLTKAAISKRTKEIRRELHLSINANNKSPNASHRYSETNRSPLRLDRAC